jgi:hypothetical protein
MRLHGTAAIAPSSNTRAIAVVRPI